MLFENGFSTINYPSVFIVLKDHKEVIILDLDGGLIEIMLSFLCRVEDMESTSKIIIASSFATLKNEILIPIPPMWLSIWYHLLPAMSLRSFQKN